MINKITCKVCGNEFEPRANFRYTSKKTKTTMFDQSEYLDCFDCIVCGCQIVVGPRHPKIDGTFGKDYEAVYIDEFLGKITEESEEESDD